MRFEHLLARMDGCKQDQKHLCLLYLNACASCLPDGHRAILAQKICFKLDLDAKGFARAMAQTSFWWQTRIDRLDLLAAESSSLEIFEKKTRALKSRKGIPFSRARSLIVQLYSLTLQKYSLQTGKNRLRTRDLARLDSLLTDPAMLRPYLKIIYRPYYLVQTGELKVTDQEFLDAVLIRVQLLADYLEAHKKKDRPKMVIICQFIQALKRMDEHEVRAFLVCSPPETSSFLPAPSLSSGQKIPTEWAEHEPERIHYELCSPFSRG